MKVATMLSYRYLINSLQHTPIKKNKEINQLFFTFLRTKLWKQTVKRDPSPPEHIETAHVSQSVEECGQGGGGGLLKELAFRSQVPPSLCSGWQMPFG